MLWLDQTPAPLLGAVVCALLATTFIVNYRTYSGKQLPPGRLGWPFSGLRLLLEGFRTLHADLRGDGPKKIRVLVTPTVVIWDFEQVKQVINSSMETVGTSWLKATLTLLGYSSITGATGALHRMLRRVVGPCLSPQAVESYLPAIQRICERYCATWAAATAAAEVEGEEEESSSGSLSAAADAADGAAASAGGRSTGSGVDIRKLPKLQAEAKLLTFEVICHVVAGFRFDSHQLQLLSEAFDTLTRGLFVPFALAIPGSAYAKALAARKVLVAALDKQIVEAKARSPASSPANAPPATARSASEGTGGGGGGLQTKSTSGSDLRDVGSSSNNNNRVSGSGKVGGDGSQSVIERLLEVADDNGRPLSREVLQDISVSLLFAGHETTAGTLIRLLMRLRSEPGIVERLRAEQRAALEKHGEAITGTALRDMPYLDAVVKEIWRVDPILPFLPRTAKKDLVVNGHDVPKGWDLLLGIGHTINFIPSIRDLPEGDPLHPRVFNPDRWLLCAPGEEPQLRPGQLASPIGMLPPQQLTFGAGLRYCPGVNLAWAETKIFLCVLMRRYEVSAPLPHMDMDVFPTVTVTGGFPIQVRPLAVEAVAAA